MEVFAVFQTSDTYDFPCTELVCICETMSKAEQVKEELDKKVIKNDEIWTIMSEADFWNWDPTTSTQEEYQLQEERYYLAKRGFEPADIKTYKVI